MFILETWREMEKMFDLGTLAPQRLLWVSDIYIGKSFYINIHVHMWVYLAKFLFCSSYLYNLHWRKNWSWALMHGFSVIMVAQINVRLQVSGSTWKLCLREKRVHCKKHRYCCMRDQCQRGLWGRGHLLDQRKECGWCILALQDSWRMFHCPKQ